jgi:hypothetical protein
LTIPAASGPVVWWREARSVVEVPRRHSIGWCHVTGQPHGRLEIPSCHFRLDRRQIETALTSYLADQHPTSDPPRVAPAYLLEDQLTIEAQLRVAGHRIVERDLVTAYGLQVVGGTVATLPGQGVDATIVCDRALSHPVREATLHAATEVIAQFRDAAPADLFDAGWERAGEHGWQLLIGQR